MIDTESEAWRQMRLLVEILPFVAQEECFALKGGTAINLFVLDLPRISVDIDLIYLPRQSHAKASIGIDAALRRIAGILRSASPPYAVAEGKADEHGRIDTLTVSGRDAQVKIETNAVLRGTLYPVRKLDVRPVVEQRLGFAQIAVVSDADLYGGKLVAALDRQHPRDLFDALVLLERDGLTDEVFHAFLLYLAGHKGVIAHTLEPRRRKLDELFGAQFQGMTDRGVTVADLEEARERLIGALHARIGPREREFLLSVKRRQPDWSLVPVEGASDWPAVGWKLHNLGRMTADRHAAAVANLDQVLERIGR